MENNNNNKQATNGEHLGSNGLNIKNEAMEHTMEAQVSSTNFSRFSTLSFVYFCVNFFFFYIYKNQKTTMSFVWPLCCMRLQLHWCPPSPLFSSRRNFGRNSNANRPEPDRPINSKFLTPFFIFILFEGRKW